MKEQFAISQHEPLESESDLPSSTPEDDPDDVDLFFWRYFHDHNRRIRVHVGSNVMEGSLDIDVRIIMRNLPRLVGSLEIGKSDCFSFLERGIEVYMTPNGETMLCRVHRWGTKTEEPTVACDAAQVIGE